MEILLFGITRDIVQKDKIEEPPFDQATTIGELKSFLKESYPEISKLSSLAFAVNEEYATDATPIKINDEIAVIPPVSGG